MTGKSPKHIRVAIVGAGYVAKHHINALRTLDFVEIVGIADLNLEVAQAMAKQFGIKTAVRRLSELAGVKPDTVYVLTPPSTHCPITLEALDMGCNVFVEKPMAETAAECDAMIAKANEKGLLLSVNHSDRLDPIVLSAIEKVRAGVVGDLIAVDFFRGSEYAPYAGGPRKDAYRKGSYPFQDIGAHGLYLLEAFLGPIQHVDVEYRSVLRDVNLLFDDWHAHARCEKGIGRLHLSWTSRPMQNRLIIQGTRGSIEVDRFLQTITVNKLLPGPKFVGMVLNAVFGSLRRAVSVCVSVVRFALKSLRPSPGIFAGAIDFARAVAESRPPAVLADEGRRNVAMMEPHVLRADAEAQATFAARLAPLPPADALVTGANGFLGSAVLRRLVAQGKSVRVLVRRRVGWIAELPRVQIVIGDLGDPEIVDHAIAGVNTVYHVGATMRGWAEQFRSGTTVAVRNVIDSCLKHATERLVYVSSLSVMDHAGRDPARVLREDAPYEPHPAGRGMYTQTKLDAEKTVLEAIEKRGLPAVVIRPGQIFGPGAERVPPNGVIALGGRWTLVGSGRYSLPLVYVDDVVDALMLAGTRPGVAGKTFNIVDPTIMLQDEYLAACRTKFGDTLKIGRVSTGVMMTLAGGVEGLGKLLGRDMPLSRYKVRSLRPLANFDGTAARDTLGWEPRVGSREGLARTYASEASGVPNCALQ